MMRLSVAAIRMDAAYAETGARLERAEALVRQAAEKGAQVAVLPEVFNSGYEYHPRNYGLAEPLDGPTVAWMKSAARRYRLHLAGSLLVREAGEIFNRMLLVSPTGQVWRYDKSYPWVFERAYFCPRQHPIAPAETELGKIGMLICWDMAHADLWAAYAGKVDLMLVSSCPPLLNQAMYGLPDGTLARQEELGFLMNVTYRNSAHVFGVYPRQQSAWLGVPLVNTTGGGLFRSGLPRPRLALSVLFAFRPDLWKYLRQAGRVRLVCGYFDETFIADSRGRVLGRTRQDGDDLAVASLDLAAETPAPCAKQPVIGLSRMAYWMDAFANRLLEKEYDRHKAQ